MSAMTARRGTDSAWSDAEPGQRDGKLGSEPWGVAERYEVRAPDSRCLGQRSSSRTRRCNDRHHLAALPLSHYVSGGRRLGVSC